MKQLLFLIIGGIVAIYVVRSHRQATARWHRDREIASLIRPHHDYHERFNDPEPARDSIVYPRDPDDASRGLEVADGLPVPVLRGSRVDSAEFVAPEPPAPPPPPKHVRRAKPPKAPKHARPAQVARPDAHELRQVAGRLSADPQRARADARSQLEGEVARWLDPEVPRSWRAPGSLIDPMVRDTRIKPVEKDYATVYEATQTVDFSARR